MKLPPRGTIARNARIKALAMRNKQDLTDLETNTRKRRRLARRLIKDQPLFAFSVLATHIPGYQVKTFQRDIRPVKGRKAKGRRISARRELHAALLEKLDITNPQNRIVTKILLNWENLSKPFTFQKFGMSYKFPRDWSLNQVQRTSLAMLKISSAAELEAFWNNQTSFGK